MQDILDIVNSWTYTNDINELTRRRKLYENYMADVKKNNRQGLIEIFSIKIKALINVIPIEKEFPNFEKLVFDNENISMSYEELGKFGEAKVHELINIIGFDNILLPERMGHSTIEWPNQTAESYLPYDLKSTVHHTYLGSNEIVVETFFDVKTTLGSYNNPIYFSSIECDFIKNVISKNSYYLVARVYSTEKVERSFYLAKNLFVKFILINTFEKLESALIGFSNNSIKISPDLI